MDVYVPEEDAPVEARRSDSGVEDEHVEIAVIGLPRIANFDEFDPLGAIERGSSSVCS